MFILLFLFNSVVLFLTPAQAEYRVFVLQITKTAVTSPELAKDPKAEPAPPTIRTLISTLDPEQYIGYFPLEEGETIKYTDTWMCTGRTGGFQPTCANPRLVKINP